jgi:hypothetical protein
MMLDLDEEDASIVTWISTSMQELRDACAYTSTPDEVPRTNVEKFTFAPVAIAQNKAYIFRQTDLSILREAPEELANLVPLAPGKLETRLLSTKNRNNSNVRHSITEFPDDYNNDDHTIRLTSNITDGFILDNHGNNTNNEELFSHQPPEITDGFVLEHHGNNTKNDEPTRTHSLDVTDGFVLDDDDSNTDDDKQSPSKRPRTKVRRHSAAVTNDDQSETESDQRHKTKQKMTTTDAQGR